MLRSPMHKKKPLAGPLCDTQLYSPAEDLDEMREVKHCCRRVEHLLLTCPRVISPLPPWDMAALILRRDLLAATAADVIALRVVGLQVAFPSAVPEPLVLLVAAVCSGTLLLDPKRALRNPGGTRGDAVAQQHAARCYIAQHY